MRIFLFLVINIPTIVLAGELSFCNICENFRVEQKKGELDVRLYCPNESKPFLTIQNCPNASLKRKVGTKEFTLICNNKAIKLIGN